MNVRSDIWGPELGYSRDELKNPAVNVQAGAQVLSRIIADLPAGASVAQVATRYNNGSAGVVSDYGARVQRVYDTQAWTAAGHPSYNCGKIGC